MPVVLLLVWLHGGHSRFRDWSAGLRARLRNRPLLLVTLASLSIAMFCQILILCARACAFVVLTGGSLIVRQACKTVCLGCFTSPARVVDACPTLSALIHCKAWEDGKENDLAAHVQVRRIAIPMPGADFWCKLMPGGGRSIPGENVGKTRRCLARAVTNLAPAIAFPIAAAVFASYLCHELRAEPFPASATAATFAAGIRTVRSAALATTA